MGKSRCYIIKPRGVELHIPTDLLGIITADYDENRSDGDWASALNRACSLIKKEISRIGTISRSTLLHHREDVIKSITSSEVIFESELSIVDLSLLMKLLAMHTASDEGISSFIIKRDVPIKAEYIDLSILKLMKLGMIERLNEIEDDNTPYYAYKITQDGINSVVKNEQRLLTLTIPTNLSNRSNHNNLTDLPF